MFKFNLEKLIYITILTLPVYLVKIKAFGIPINFLEVLIIGVLVRWLLNLKLRNFPKLGFGTMKKYFFPLGLITAGLVMSTLANKNYAAGLGIIKGWFILPLLFAVAAKNVFQGKEKELFKAVFFSSALAAAFAIIYFALGKVTYDGRLEAFFNSSNYLAMYLAPGIITGFFLGRENKRMYLPPLSLILIAFYLTYSYAAWLAVVASLFLVNLFQNTGGKKKTFIVLAGIAALLVLLVSQSGSNKFLDLEKYSRSSLESRIMIWKAAEKIIADHWLWGVGPGNFQSQYLEYQKYFPPYLEWAVPHPHNLFLAFWLQAGLLGLVGFLILIFFWFNETLKKENGELSYISLAIMLYVLIHGLADTTYFKNDLSVVFWLNFLLIL